MTTKGHIMRRVFKSVRIILKFYIKLFHILTSIFLFYSGKTGQIDHPQAGVN